METLTGQNPARPSEIMKPPVEKTTHEEGIPSTSNYVVALKSSTIPGPCANRYGNPEVKARYSTHNGMPTVIFKASDYYGVMAEECRLTIVDDIVIFSSGSHRSIKLIMHQIKKYEQSSGQMVNKEKCFFLTAPKT
uniref:Reverse transcriptase domain-containing protein n=1 Tax=Nicotiana tabacum TaxID=4097 RepID=A0A1S4AJM4_TOBAC|nr:uncharacterized protein LOC104112649 [Nicotiana tomentosiformis]XP_016476814.1 PREDICTED: uncharacterized protein LOC107798353 [Nicotiana tabacum]